MSGDFERIAAFILELDRLKAVARRTKPMGLDRRENPAEHSWQAALLALLLAPRASQPVDAVRAVELLLVHDIPEIDAGDQFVYARDPNERSDAEGRAAKRIFGLLPEPEATQCLARWAEFEARTTPEAIFAYAIDRLLPVLQNLRHDGQSWRDNDVTLEQVVAVNSAIGVILPDVWDEVRAQVTAWFKTCSKPA